MTTYADPRDSTRLPESYRYQAVRRRDGARWYQDSTERTLVGRDMSLLPPKVEADLERLANLPANWDGNGTSALDPATVARARFVLGFAFSFGGEELPVPFLSPSRDGRLILEWELEPSRELILDVSGSPDSPIRFLLVEPEVEGGESEIESEISDKWSMQGIVRRFLSRRLTQHNMVPDAMVGSNPKNDS